MMTVESPRLTDGSQEVDILVAVLILSLSVEAVDVLQQLPIIPTTVFLGFPVLT